MFLIRFNQFYFQGFILFLIFSLNHKIKLMSNGFYNVPYHENEPVLSYEPGSDEKESLIATYNELYAKKIEVPMYIGGEEVTTDDKRILTPPHDHKHIVGNYNFGTKKHVKQAIDAALEAKEKWANLPWHQRVSIFLKAADLLAGPYRAKMNAATMIAQSKSCYQAEIDAACELIDFLRYNVAYVSKSIKISLSRELGFGID